MPARKIVPLTPEQLAEARAAHIVELRAKINELEGLLAAETGELIRWVESSGQVEFETLKASKRVGAARLVGDEMTENELAYAKEQLVNELPGFVTKSLDLKKMFNALRTDAQVANALDARGLSMEQKTTWALIVK